jgi:ketosteroid isomerase-like protein
MSTEEQHLETARDYLRALAAGAPFDVIARLLHPDIVFETLPNRIVPTGARADLALMRLAAERGAANVRDQRYDVRAAIAVGDTVALEVEWVGTLVQARDPLPAGFVMRARCAFFLQFRDGRIVAQRNYDCFEPW